MISPLNFDKTFHLPPQQFKAATIQVINELIEQVNRLDKERLELKEKLDKPVTQNKGGRPSAKTRKVV